MARGIGFLSTTLALAVLVPRAAEPQSVAISDNNIVIGSDEVLTTGDAVSLYARGTGANNLASRLVKLGDTVLVDDVSRGLTLTVLDAATQTEVSSTNYDTWASRFASDQLAAALDTMSFGQIGVLTSYDAFERALTPDLRASAFRLGLLRLAATPSVPDAVERRHPYAAVFHGSDASAPSPQVVEIVQSNSPGAPRAVLVSWLIGGGFVGQGYPSVAPPPRYVDCGDGAVWDSQLNLYFLKDATCAALAGTDGWGRADWAGANAAAAALADPTCGLSDGSSAGDWRLATKAEWELAIAQGIALGCTGDGSTEGPGLAPSLTDDPGMNCQWVGPSSFVGLQPEIAVYWSATAYDASAAWRANLFLGTVSSMDKDDLKFVWPVRPGH